MNRLLRKSSSLCVFASAVMLSLLSSLFTVSLQAQVANGISGTVTDPDGRLMPDVHLRIRNVSTGVLTEATTSSAGVYNAVGLIPGPYTVEATQSGFSTTVTKIVVEVAKISTLNIALTLGSASETVRVDAGQLSLNTTTEDIGTTLGAVS